MYTLTILVFSLLALPKRNDDARSFAWFILVLFALSPVTASSHFILLLVPIVLLLKGESLSWSAGLIALYILVQLSLRTWDAWLFPKLWCILALAIYVGWRYLAQVRIGPAMAAAAGVLAVSAGLAYTEWTSYQLEPQVADRHAVVEPGAIFSSAPVLREGAMVYESIAQDRFVLRSSEPAGSRTFKFEGHAFHPSTPLSGDPIYFELLAGGHSYISAYHESTRAWELVDGVDVDAVEPAISPDGSRLAYVSGGSIVLFDGESSSLVAGGAAGELSGPAFTPDNQHIVFAEGQPGYRSIRSVAISTGEPTALIQGGDCFQPSVAPDGSSLAFSCSGSGGSQIWLLDLKTGTRHQLTHGPCNNTHPAWDPGSRTIVFSSDCNRGVEDA